MTSWNEIENVEPKDDGKYIVCTEKGSIFFARYYKHGNGGHFGVGKNVKITHWMPFPSLPNLKKALCEGYKVVMCNKIGDELEYIVERKEDND